MKSESPMIQTQMAQEAEQAAEYLWRLAERQTTQDYVIQSRKHSRRLDRLARLLCEEDPNAK